MQQEDKIILEYISSRDPEIFNEIYEKYKNLVYYLVLQSRDIIKSPENAVQEIFYKIFISIDTFNYKCGSFKTWILAITRNYIIDYARTSDKIEFDNELINETADPNCNESNGLMEFLETILTKEELEMIVLRYVYNFKYKDIAVHMGITIDVCKKQIRKIKDKVNEERERYEKEF